MHPEAPPADALAGWIQGQRWFAAKTRRVEAVGVEDWIPVGSAAIAIASVRLDDGTSQRYAVPLGGSAGELTDALADPPFAQALLAAVAAGAVLPSEGRGELRGHSTPAFPADLSRPAAPRLLGGEQSNTSVVFGERLIMKFFRRLTEGINPEREMTQFLTERGGFAHCARLAGHLDFRQPGGGETTVVVVQDFVPDGRDGWRWMLEQIGAVYDRARRSGAVADRDRVRDWARGSLRALHRLGELTASLHRALGQKSDDAAFAPEPISRDDIDAWAADIRRQVAAARSLLPPGLRLAEPTEVGGRLEALIGRQKIRHHGDFHLGQTLYREHSGDFVIIDFEGEPLRPLAERRRKHTPLRDVAGMLRSIDYAAMSAPRGEEMGPWAEAWTAEGGQEFLGGYQATAGAAPFLPGSEDEFRRVVAAFELEKAAYEIVYEANHRPQWLAIPARGLVRAAARLRGPAAGAE